MNDNGFDLDAALSSMAVFDNIDNDTAEFEIDNDDNNVISKKQVIFDDDTIMDDVSDDIVAGKKEIEADEMMENHVTVDCETILQDIMNFIARLVMSNDVELQNATQDKINSCGFSGDSVEEFEIFLRSGGDDRVSGVYDVFFNQTH